MATTALALGFASVVGAIDVPKEFGEYKAWLENASMEEKREHFN